MPCWVLPPRPSSQRSLLAGTPASRRSRGPRPTRRCWPCTPRTPRSQPATTLQSALDAILAELAAPLQLSGSGGVVNTPAWAGFTTWELVRGSNVVRNLHLEAPLSAALANSIAAADAALAAALLAYYILRSGRVVGRLPNGHGAGGDRCHFDRAAGLLHIDASGRPVGRLPHSKRGPRPAKGPNWKCKSACAAGSAPASKVSPHGVTVAKRRQQSTDTRSGACGTGA